MLIRIFNRRDKEKTMIELRLINLFYFRAVPGRKIVDDQTRLRKRSAMVEIL